MSDVTRLLCAVEHGDPQAAEELLPLVYEQLQQLARHQMAREKPGQTLQATALVHEAWLKLTGTEPRQWENRRHFFRAAAAAMRRILVDRARSKARPRHGGDLHRTELSHAEVATEMPPEELLALNEALDRLAALDPQAGELIHLRFFVGLTQAEAAACLGISRSSADRDWAFARAWLFRELRGSGVQ